MDTKLSLEGQHFYALHPNKLSEMGETEVAFQPALWEFCLTLVLPRCLYPASVTHYARENSTNIPFFIFLAQSWAKPPRLRWSSGSRSDMYHLRPLGKPACFPFLPTRCLGVAKSQNGHSRFFDLAVHPTTRNTHLGLLSEK